MTPLQAYTKLKEELSVNDLRIAQCKEYDNVYSFLLSPTNDDKNRVFCGGIFYYVNKQTGSVSTSDDTGRITSRPTRTIEFK